MKILKLVTVVVEEVPVADYSEFYHTTEADLAIRVENSPYVIPDVYINRKDIPISVWHTRDKPDKLLAIHPAVKRELLTLQEPELMKSVMQEHTTHVKDLIREKARLSIHFTSVLETKGAELHSIKHAPWYTRLKWVLTGVK